MMRKEVRKSDLIMRLRADGEVTSVEEKKCIFHGDERMDKKVIGPCFIDDLVFHIRSFY